MVVLSVLNKKGGVGKTTIATNMAQGLAVLGKRVLVIDNDEQHNLTTSLGLSVKRCPIALSDVMNASPHRFEELAAGSIVQSFIENLDCVAGGRGLENIVPRNTFFRDFLQSAAVTSQNYEIVIIDNAPTMSAKAHCAILGSDIYLLPVQLKQFAVNGLYEMYEILTHEYQIPPEKIMILRNMYRETKAYEINSRALEMAYPKSILETIIPYNDSLYENMVCKSKTIFFSHTSHKGTLNFQRLICEVFGFDEEEMLEILKVEIKKYKAEIAKIGLNRANIINSTKNKKEKGVGNDESE